MDDEKIISDRTLELEAQEEAEHRRAAKLPSDERDPDAPNVTTRLTGAPDEGPTAGTGDSGDGDLLPGGGPDGVRGAGAAARRLPTDL